MTSKKVFDDLDSDLQGDESSNENYVRQNRVDLSLLVLRVPEDYPDLKAAIFSQEVLGSSPHRPVEIKLNPNYKIKEGLLLKGGDFSNIEVSCDGQVELGSGFPTDRALFHGERGAKMPRLSCLVDMQELGKYGILLTQNSSMVVSPQAGIMRAGATAASIQSNSRLYAYQAIFASAKETALVAQFNSQVHCRSCSLINAGLHGILVTDGSSVYAPEAKIHDAGTFGVYAARSSIVSADSSDIRYSGSHAIVVTTSSIANLSYAYVFEAGDDGVHVTQNGSLHARELQIVNAQRNGIRVSSATATMVLSNVEASGQHGVLVDNIGSLDFNGSDASGSLVQGVIPFDIVSRRGGRIHASNVPDTNRMSPAERGVHSIHGVIY